MFNNTNEDSGSFYSDNDVYSNNKDINSPKIRENENCFFFTITDANFKENNNNESHISDSIFQNINCSLDDSTNFFDKNPNPEEIFINKYDKPNEDSNIVSEKNSKGILFDISKPKKKGRTPKFSGNKKEHDKHCLDNILTKIQVHFLSFVINLSNDALKAKFGEKTPFHFKHLSHGIKKKINYGAFCENKNCIIKEILKKDISSKYKKCDDPKINEKVLEEVCQESKWLDDFFNLKYIKVFKDYYNSEYPLKEIEYNRITFKLSDKTKNLSYLLKKNDAEREEINNTIKQVFLNVKTGYCGEDPFTLKKKKIE